MKSNKLTLDDVLDELTKTHSLKEVVGMIDEMDIDLNVPIEQPIKSLGKEKYDINVTNKQYELIFDEFLLQNRKRFIEINFALKNLKQLKNLAITNGRMETGITNTGDSLKVFSKIVSTCIVLLKRKLPDYITFQAREEKRQRLYHRIIKYLHKHLPEYKQIDVSPLTNEKTENDEFWLEKI